MKQPDSFELTRVGKPGRIENMNTTVAEIADEQVSTEPAKIIGR